MTNYYSRIDPTKLLHVIYRFDDPKYRVKEFNGGRTEITNPEEFLQCAALQMNYGKTFRPHRHIIREQNNPEYHAQESWVVIQGSVATIFYDIDDTFLAVDVLKAGDASFSLSGGHNYLVLEDDTLVYEFKTGPYLGQALDKTFIDE